MKRGIFSEKKRLFMKRVTHEREFFRYQMLSSARDVIYNSCNKIRFVECVFEYLIYTEDISDDWIDELLKCENRIFDSLYGTYLEYEYLRVGTWEEIEELIRVHVTH